MLDTDAIRRQLRQRLEGLRHAGVTFLPRIWELPGPSINNSENPSATHSPPSAVANVAEDRRIELRLLAERVSKCTRCPELASTRTQTVFGVGPFDPELCFVGEA